MVYCVVVVVVVVVEEEEEEEEEEEKDKDERCCRCRSNVVVSIRFIFEIVVQRFNRALDLFHAKIDIMMIESLMLFICFLLIIIMMMIGV